MGTDLLFNFKEDVTASVYQNGIVYSASNDPSKWNLENTNSKTTWTIKLAW